VKYFSLNITQKLQLMAAALLLMAGGPLVKCVYEVTQSDKVINSVIAEHNSSLTHLGNLQKNKQRFNDMRYWYSDLAVGWLSESEDEAEAAYAKLQAGLDEMAHADAPGSAEITGQIAEFRALMRAAVDAYIDGNRVLGNSKVAKARELATQIASRLDRPMERFKSDVRTANDALVANNSALMREAVLGLLVAILIGPLLAYFASRRITQPLREAVDVADRIAAGDFTNKFTHSSGDETGQLQKALISMQDALREQIEKEREAAARNTRLKHALDNASAAITVGDADNRIVYMNAAFTTMMRNAQDDIRQDIPDFQVDMLMDSSLEIFNIENCKDVAEQASLSQTSIEGVLGGHAFRIVSTPVLDDQNIPIGTVIECYDRTEEIAVENEVQGIVEAALAGELERRITTQDKSGFFRHLGESIHELMSVNGHVIDDIGRVMGAMARGDLTQTIEAEYRGDYARLKQDTNATANKLRGVLAEIKGSSHAVKSGSEEISCGNANLSERTEQQAANLEETAASMEEMTSTVRQNATRASTANDVSVEACNKAERGGEVVGQAVLAMSEINDSSRKIVDIISVIDEIAFQTNLLALNASVEAARAGEHGRGFAVVASEVRNLAGRSATAAKEIKSLIEDSVLKVEEGTRLVDASGQTLQEIVTAVQQVTELMGEIAEASQEQSSGIQQVNNSIVHMDEITGQNAALVEQVTAASVSMGEQASRLAELVSFFDVGTGGETAPATSAAADGERRGADRPWTAPADAKKPENPGKAVSTTTRGGIAGQDEIWYEF